MEGGPQSVQNTGKEEPARTEAKAALDSENPLNHDKKTSTATDKHQPVPSSLRCARARACVYVCVRVAADGR